MIHQKYVEFAVEKTLALLAIDSPTGYTEQAAKACLDEFKALGFDARLTAKGGVVADLGGEDETDALWLEAHLDTLGGMVSEIKGNGRLRISPLGASGRRTPRRRTAVSSPSSTASMRAPYSSITPPST